MVMTQINISELVTRDKTDSISGRDLGIEYAKQIKLLDILSKGEQIEFHIDSELVKAINDSFIKGLFNDVFKKYKRVDEIRKRVSINANDHFQKLFLKNWLILQEIHNV